MGCVVGQSQTQLSPSRLAPVGLTTSLPGCPRSSWLPWGTGPLLAPCGAEAGVWCQCHLVASVPGLLTSLLLPQLPTDVPRRLQGHPLALGSERCTFLWDGMRSVFREQTMGWLHRPVLAASGGIRACTQRQMGPAGRLPLGNYFMYGMKWCPLPALPALPAVKALPMEG